MFSDLDWALFVLVAAAAAGWRLSLRPPLPRQTRSTPAQDWAEFERVHGRQPPGTVIHGAIDHKGRMRPVDQWKVRK